MTLQVLAQVSLKPFNSFGIDVRAQLFAEAHSDDDVREALAYSAAHAVPLLVIGGGSNLLLTQDIPALVLRMATRGIRVLHDDANGAGASAVPVLTVDGVPQQEQVIALVDTGMTHQVELRLPARPSQLT